ncbi:hypothetical protein IW138_001034 [Coemansia sp. RSA 986]|nr:hypothetical protein IW138_001034 [Coemansia sp. RSA 986]
MHPLSQISFRLSQRPPSNQRKFRRQLDRADSIEDSDASDHMSISTPSQENSTERHNRLAAAEKTAAADSIFDYAEPPTLSSPVLSFTSTASYRPLGTPEAISTATASERLQAYKVSVQNTPSKRPRYEGIAAAEFRKAVSQEASEFCMWWHCLSGELGPSRVCQRPQASFRLRMQCVQRMVQPHLFCVETEVEDIASAEANSFLVAGKPLTVLLSVAVCMDALPREAKKMVDKLVALETNTSSDMVSSVTDSCPLFVSVYEPWRVQGKGEQLCLFASRFDLE